MSKISLKGILIGACAEMVISTIDGIAFLAYVISSHDLSLSPQIEIQTRSIVLASPVLLGLNTIIGLLNTIIGGYFAAKFSKHNPLLNSALVSFATMPIGLYVIYRGSAALPFPFNFLVLAVAPLFYMAGGYIWLKQVGKNAKP